MQLRKESHSTQPRKESRLDSQLIKKLVEEVERSLRPERLDPPTSKRGERERASEAAESESWLDWGLNLAKEWGPQLLEVAPELLALL